ADPVLAVRVDEISEAHVGPSLALLHLLAEEGEPGPVVACEHEDVIAFSLATPQADGRFRSNPTLGDDLIEHGVGVREQAARALADDWIIEDLRIIAGQLPGTEERRPVDRGLQVGERPVAEMVET